MVESVGCDGQGEAVRLRAAAAALLSLAERTEGGSCAADVPELLAVIEQAELVLCRRVERVDRGGEFAADGSASTTSWLRAQANCSGGLASRRVRVGRALADRLPHTSAAWAAGGCTFEHADVIALAVRGLEHAQTVVLDRELSLLAARLSPVELSRVAARFRHEVAPEEAEARARRAKREQKLHHSPTFDGRWVLSATFDAEAGAVVKAAIDAFTPLPQPAGSDQPAGQDQPAGRAGELPVSAGFRRAQALEEICRQALEHGQGRGAGGEKPQLVVTVDDKVLREGIGCGTLADGTPIPSRAVRRLACDAQIIPVLYGTKSCPLDVGRSVRLVTTAIRRALVLRDQGCRFTGCDRPASWTDAHHIVSWRDGRPTALTNLLLLCRAHHHRIHHDGWTITPLGDGRFRFHPPDPLGSTDPPRSRGGPPRYGRAA